MKHDKIGFVGLGIMGLPMAKNLIKAGCSLMINDLNQEAVKKLTELGAKAATLSEIGEKCKLVLTILPTGTIVKNVLFSENGLTSTLSEGSLVVDMSSVTPGEAQFCEEKLAERKIGFMDAPVSGGEPKAIDGTLSFMVGGTQENFEKMKAYFEIMGASALLTGPCGSGCVTKLSNQIIVNLTIAAVSEALVFAAKAGVDPEKVYQAIRGGLAGSTVLDAKAPMMIEHNFKPGGKISINLKDIKNVMATAHEIDSPLPMTGQLLEIMQTLKVQGHLNEDHSGIVQYFEQLSDVTVCKK